MFDGSYLSMKNWSLICDTKSNLNKGLLYPPLNQIRDISIQIATKVAEKAIEMGDSEMEPLGDVESTIRSQAFIPEYRSYI